jgi:hypothetical protein
MAHILLSQKRYLNPNPCGSYTFLPKRCEVSLSILGLRDLCQTLPSLEEKMKKQVYRLSDTYSRSPEQSVLK